jgi:hypothetical protein
MSKKENQSITYVYDEMDPSEKLEFERDLEYDDNLLIEVESFKKISERLFELKPIQPPAELYEEILNKACMFRKKQKFYSDNRYMFAAAAIIIMGFTSGVFLLNSSAPGPEMEAGSAMMGTPEIVVSTPAVPSDDITNQNMATLTGTGGVTQMEASRIEPWVDENDVIHFYERFGYTNNASLDSMFHHSFQKLTPVTDPSQSISIQRHLHLTGGQR